MLIHITPKLVVGVSSARPVRLLTLQIPEIGLSLTEEHLAVRRPYPNKHYFVGCRRIGQQAMSGILIQHEGFEREFTAEMVWSVADARHVKHTVVYQVLDDDYDLVSDSMLMWRCVTSEGRDWPSRWPAIHTEFPAMAEPRMSLWAGEDKRTAPVDEVQHGLITSRYEKFPLPTLEPDRWQKGADWKRLPPLEHAFRTGAQDIEQANSRG